MSIRSTAHNISKGLSDLFKDLMAPDTTAITWADNQYMPLDMKTQIAPARLSVEIPTDTKTGSNLTEFDLSLETEIIPFRGILKLTREM